MRACSRAAASLLAAACATAPGSRPAGHQLREQARLRRPRELLADQPRVPSGQLREPVQRNTALGRVPERERDQMRGAVDRLDRGVLAALRTALLPHRGDDFTVALGRGGELALGLGPGDLRRVDGGHRERPGQLVALVFI